MGLPYCFESTPCWVHPCAGFCVLCSAAQQRDAPQSSQGGLQHKNTKEEESKSGSLRKCQLQ